MTDQMLHTPDGVRDIYNGECKQKLLLQERLHDVLRQYGYRDIQTPTFEFFNIFGKMIYFLSLILSYEKIRLYGNHETGKAQQLVQHHPKICISFLTRTEARWYFVRILLHLLQEVLQSTIPRMICR